MGDGQPRHHAEAELYPQVRKWYARDRGETTIREVLKPQAGFSSVAKVALAASKHPPTPHRVVEPVRSAGEVEREDGGAQDP